MLKKLALLVAAFYAGILSAPKSGSETRKELAEKAKTQTKKLKESMKKK